MARRKRRQASLALKASLPKRPSRTRRFVNWLAAAGFLVAAVGLGYQHFFGNVYIEYVQALQQGYEFQFKNDTPSDRVVKKFRVLPPSGQQVVYKITKDIEGQIDTRTNTVRLPGGNVSEVPAARYKQLDGRLLAANTSSKFRIPPLSDRTWVEPEASIVDFKYELEPSNSALASINKFMVAVGLHKNEKTVRYLVVHNYWVPAFSSSVHEAVTVACREDASLAKLSICEERR